MTDVLEEAAALSVIIGGGYVDRTRVGLPLVHTYGRADAGVQPEAPTVTFDWLGPLTYTAGGAPQDLVVGLPLRLEVGQAFGGIWSDIWDDLWSPALPPGSTSVPRVNRFTGRISDLRPSTDEDTMVTQVTAVGTMAEAAVYPLGAAPWPQQAESARVLAIMAALPYTLVNDGGPPVLLGLDVDRRPAIEVLQEMAAWTGAVLWEDGDGRLRYTGQQARAAVSPAGAPVVPVTAILAPVDWDQAVGNVVNDVTVLWGALSPQAEVTLRADASYAQFGRRHATISTSLAVEDDATIFAQLVLAHWAQPAWDAPQISVPMGTISDALWKALMGLNLGQVLLTDGVSSTPSTPAGQGRWLVEGWRDEYDRDDSGLLRHTLQFAVSDYDRWTASGQLGTTTTAVAAPTTAPYGTPITVTATVKDENGTLVAAGGGTVDVYDGATLLGSRPLGAGGTAAVPVTPPTGARTLVARYSGDTGHEGSQGSVPVTVTAVTTATVALAISDTDVNLGQSTKLTATVTPSTAPGTIEWSYTRDGGAWTVWSGQDVPVVAGKGTATWTPGGAGHDYVWRARYVPAAGEPYNSPISNTVAVVVRQKVSHTRTFGATWSASFQQDGDKRSDTSDCYQGYYSGTNGNQKALAGFANPWPSGETVTKVRVRITTPHWNSASGGTLVLGSDDATAEPGSWPSGVNTDRLRTSMERDQTKWIDVTSWGTGWRALAFGPGPSTSSTYYGYAEGVGTDEPQVEVTSYEWV